MLLPLGKSDRVPRDFKCNSKANQKVGPSLSSSSQQGIQWIHVFLFYESARYYISMYLYHI